MKISCYLTGLLLLVSLTVVAQLGSLDLTFSGDGKVTTGFLLPSVASTDNSYAMAIQGDGKVVVAGYTFTGPNHDFAVVRYNATGTLDNTFGGDGKISTDISGGEDEAFCIAIQPDGKIVVAGYAFGQTSDFAVVRYNTNGTLDNTFSGGIVITNIQISAEIAHSIAIQADGKIVVVGTTAYGPGNVLVIRYNANGTLDSSFNGNGKLSQHFLLYNEGRSVALQADGKIIVAGYAGDVENDYLFAVFRYNIDGTPDNTFSEDGIMTTKLNFFSSDRAYSVSIQADGKIVVAGTSGSSTLDFAVVRYNINGTPDNSFSNDGQLTTDIAGNDDEARLVLIQADGKIVVAGYSYNGANYDFTVVRYNANGAPDNTFSGDGKLTTSISSGDDVAHSLAIQANGKITVAGKSKGTTIDFAVVRYNADGTFDNSFAGDGKISTDFGGADATAFDYGNAVAVNSNGRIVVVGTSFISGPAGSISIIQYKANGAVDNTFGFQGKVLGEFEGGKFIANATAIQSNGKIIVGGYFDHGKIDFALVRYNANGSLDKTFSQDGFVTTAISLSGIDKCWSIIVQPDGKILAAGSSGATATSFSDFAVVRYNANGTLDNFFSLDGKQTTDFSTNTDEARSIALQADGKIVLAGYTYNGSSFDFATARYNTNGDLDNTFSSDGRQNTNFSNNNDYGMSMKIQADGKIVLGGYSGKDSVKDNDFAIVRYNSNGTPDNTFSGDGKQLTSIDGTSADYCTSLIIESSGKIIAGGYYLNSFQQFDFALVRYLGDGTPDNTFGFNSKIITDFTNTIDYGTSMALGGDGKLVMAGNSNNDFAVARYNLTATAFAKTAEEVSTTQHLTLGAFPNPFNNTTTITYTLPTLYSNAKIIVVDNSGKIVKQANVSGSGDGNLKLNTSTFASGVYNYSLYVDGKLIATKQMILTK